MRKLLLFINQSINIKLYFFAKLMVSHESTLFASQKTASSVIRLFFLETIILSQQCEFPKG